MEEEVISTEQDMVEDQEETVSAVDITVAEVVLAEVPVEVAIVAAVSDLSQEQITEEVVEALVKTQAQEVEDTDCSEETVEEGMDCLVVEEEDFLVVMREEVMVVEEGEVFITLVEVEAALEVVEVMAGVVQEEGYLMEEEDSLEEVDMEDSVVEIVDIKLLSYTSLPTYTWHPQMKMFPSRRSSLNNQHPRRTTRLFSSKLLIHRSKKFPSYHLIFLPNQTRLSSTYSIRNQRQHLPYTFQHHPCISRTNLKSTSSVTRHSNTRKMVEAVPVNMVGDSITALAVVIIMVSTRTVVGGSSTASNM